MHLLRISKPQEFPEQYAEACEAFIKAFINKTQWSAREKLGMHGDEQFLGVFETWGQTPLAELLSQVARAATGELPNNETTRGEVHEAIQDLMETLFCPPGLGAAYSIPKEFHETDLGQMVTAAMIWAQGDELITQAEAAELVGTSVSNIGLHLDRRNLDTYIDPGTPKRQGRRKVRKAQVLRFFNK